MKLQLVFCAVAVLTPSALHAQEDGGVSYVGRGQELLESIYLPNITGAPFSLQLSTEWTRPLLQGGTMTQVNSRPIKRDSQGRIYMERWLLAPRGSRGSRMSWIQIDDPVAGKYYECNPRNHVCEVSPWQPSPALKVPPPAVKSGPTSDGKAYRQHEDLGEDVVSGVPVHGYRDTISVQAGAMGNSQPLSYFREMKWSPQLGINLVSIVQSPSLGEQKFVASDVTTTEPEAKWFRPPEGWAIVEKRPQQ